MDNSNYGQAPAQKRVERYDVISNINDMIETLRAASGVPFSSNCAVDRNEMIASLEELKNHLPASIDASKVNDHEITRGARDEADNILAAAENQADELRKSAHIYVKQLLTDANNTLSESIAKIQTNLSEIDTTIDSM